MTALILILGIGLITWAVYLIHFAASSSQEEKIDLFPGQSQQRTNSPAIRQIARYLLIFFLALTSFFYIRENLIKDNIKPLVIEDKRLISLSRIEYEEICLKTVKPALEQAEEYPSTSKSPEEIYSENAKRFAKSSAKALRDLCMAAENRYDGYRIEKFFNP